MTHGKYLRSNAMSRMTASSTRRWAPQEAKGGTLQSQVRNRDKDTEPLLQRNEGLRGGVVKDRETD